MRISCIAPLVATLTLLGTLWNPTPAAARLNDRPIAALSIFDDYGTPLGLGDWMTQIQRIARRQQQEIATRIAILKRRPLVAPPQSVKVPVVAPAPSFVVADAVAAKTEVVDLMTLAEVLADERHSLGIDVAEQINEQNDGFGDRPIATDRIATVFIAANPMAEPIAGPSPVNADAVMSRAARVWKAFRAAVSEASEELRQVAMHLPNPLAPIVAPREACPAPPAMYPEIDEPYYHPAFGSPWEGCLPR